MIVLLVLLVIAFGLFYFILTLDISGILKFFLIAIEMFGFGQFLISRYKLSGEYGLILLKSKRGLNLIYKIAEYEKLWNFLADVGAATSYGLLSLIIMRKNISIKSLISGIILLSLLFFIVSPMVIPFLASVIGVGSLERSAQQVNNLGGLTPIIAMLYLGGLFLVLLIGLILYGSFILSALFSTLLHGTQAISKATPGATFLLPGINLPFFEGIGALIIILIVHEGAHAVLARIAKIPILSSGIVLFGVIPIGAFVEPDEEKLKKLEQTKQTRVLVAGSTSNLLTSLFFFLLFISFFYATTNYRDLGLLVMPQTGPNTSNTIHPGTVIYSINGQQTIDENSINIITQLNFSSNSTFNLLTNKGQITSTTNSNGKMGVLLTPVTKNSITAKFTNPFFDVIYMLLGLSFALNFVIGTVNLLPLPFFDGYRTLELNIDNKLIVKGLMALTFVAFLVNFLPWFFKG